MCTASPCRLHKLASKLKVMIPEPGSATPAPAAAAGPAVDAGSTEIKALKGSKTGKKAVAAGTK
jgi:hypothetical protein